MKIILLYMILALSFGVLRAQPHDNARIDSLTTLYNSLNDHDINKMRVADMLLNSHYNMAPRMEWAARLIELARLNKSGQYELKALQCYIDDAYYRGDYSQSLIYSFQSLAVADSIGNLDGKARAWLDIGDAYSYLGNYPKADSYYYQCMDGFQNLNDTLDYLYCLYSLTDNLIIEKLFHQADSLLHHGISIDSVFHGKPDNYPVGLLYENLAILNYTRFTYQFSECDVSLLDKAKNDGLYSASCSRKLYRCLYYASRSLFLRAVYCNYQGEHLRQAIDSLKMMNQMFFENVDSLGIEINEELALDTASWYLLERNFHEAGRILGDMQDQMLGSEFEPNYCIVYNQYYAMQGDYKNAQHWLSRFFESVNSAISIGNAASAAQNLAETGYNYKLRLRKAAEDRRRTIYIYVIVGVVLLSLFLLMDYYRKYRHNKEISNKNKQITDSIHYASLIQKAALPTHEDLSALFGDYFLIYRPLNIVAGDFYWAARVGKYNILVCADCTGHGVPGAFVSMLGISLLNEVTANINDDTLASDILNELRAKLMKSLGQNKHKYDNGAVYSMDGMDLAMVMIDYENLTAQFAGAYRPLWIWRKGELIQIKPDKMPIGLYLGPEKNFTNHLLELSKGDVLYMFSDGIPDQFGYTDSTHTSCRHYSTKKLAALLAGIGALPSDTQKDLIEKEIDVWKNGYKQLDDNILIGVRV